MGIHLWFFARCFCILLIHVSGNLQEHRTEIDARAGTFQAFELFGQHLLQSNHYASPEVQEKLENMNLARQDLEKYVSVLC